MGKRHRSGWPFVMKALKDAKFPHDILLDDFVEGTFGRKCYYIHKEPWIGMFHIPLTAPVWAVGDQWITKTKLLQSLPNMVAAIAFSKYHARQLVTRFGFEVAIIPHPTSTPDRLWRPEQFSFNKKKKIIQVGWFLKNTAAIYELDVPFSFQAIDLHQPSSFIHNHRLRSLGRTKNLPLNHVKIWPWLSNSAYDDELARNIVFINLIDASANNTIIECIVRNTPILLNRHPAAIEYLGVAYPMFYDDIQQAHELLDETTIIAAHHYLRGLPKEHLSIESFLDSFEKVLYNAACNPKAT